MTNETYQMHIQWKVCDGAQGVNYKRSNGYVWDKSSIHHINMDPIATSLLNCFHLDA